MTGKKLMITDDRYKILAEDLMKVIFSQYPSDPSPEEFGVILGAIHIMEKVIKDVMGKRGISFEIHDMEKADKQ